MRFIFMKNEVKCYRCGTQINLTSKTLGEEITCPHCQGKMTLDKKSNRWYKVYRYGFSILLSLILVMLLFLFTTNLIILVMACILISFFISSVSDKVGLWLAFKTVGLSYEHVQTEKELRKQNKK